MFRLYGPARLRRLGTVVSGLGAVIFCASVASAQQQPAAGQPAAQAQTAPKTQEFGPDGGLVLHFIKPDKTADFEEVMGKVRDVLQKSDKPERKQQASGWKLFKSTAPPEATGGNALYVFIIDPALKGADYSPSNILAEGLPVEQVNALYAKYAGAYATGQNIINLALTVDFGKPGAAAPATAAPAAPAAAPTAPATPPPGQ